MPRPNAPLPDFLPPLAIYRHLLRECSYLPPTWSHTIVSAIRGRFRQHRKYDTRQEKHRAHAYQFLNTLRSANEGNRGVMQNLMRKALARTGPRRRTLMNKLVLRDGPSDSDALEALLNTRKTLKDISEWTTETAESTSKPAFGRTSRPPKSAFHLKWDKSKVLRLLRSQQSQQGDDYWIHKPIRHLNEDQFVRKETIWGTPTGKRVIWKRQGQFWRKAASKMMPPLKKDEWELIGRLCTAQDFDSDSTVPVRRTPAKLINDKQNSEDMGWDWEGYARYGANNVESRKSAKRSQRTGQEDTGPYSKSKSAREIGSRWYRRAYARVWKITPAMEQDPHSLKHKITWGTFPNPAVPATKSQLDIFEDVSEEIFPAVKRLKAKPQWKARKENTKGEALTAETPKDAV
ncbi:hypothetical protein B0T10DRAFT_49553 [Thelonectria olida]|uniref:LYR motif-containing protein Cup1-like N-terminal domain-containing protein n=1 Tax=Thelonectria olida TaxID=1576542 RepID=A0A9P8W3E1_9HYPO|nr:hypothetical protein B0T10DRAFT_49553 [Thelonectria olida]